MSEAENKIGQFCWNELVTSDLDAAKAFYGGLFGWTAKDVEGTDMPYACFEVNGQPVGGLMALAPEMGPVPPHWMSYVLVEDVEASVAKVEPLGGKVLQPTITVGTMGKLAVIQDPTGAVFSFWQALEDG